MRDAACSHSSKWDEDDAATTGSEESGESDGSDESMWAATTEGTMAREFQSAMEVESARDMVSLRNIHERLALEVTRSAFWEILAKESLAETVRDPDGGHGRPDDETGALSALDAHNVPGAPEVSYSTLQQMMHEMQTLGSNLDALKERASKDQCTIDALREEVKRTDRLKNGYKRQVKHLNALLESTTAPTAATTPAHSHDRQDAVDLQRKLAEMRVLLEGLRRERDSAQARADMAQGQHGELKERFARREFALTSAQRRCRDLEEALAQDERKRPGQKPGDEEYAISLERRILVDSGMSTAVTLSNADCAVQDGLVQDDGDQDVDEDQSRDQDHSEESVQAEGTNEAGRTEDPTAHADVDKELASGDVCPGSSPATLISPACPGYRRIFGDTHDLDDAAHVLISADDVLAQCAAKILQLTNELNATRDELHGIKCQCAEQYDRAYKYKTMCSSLAIKVRRLVAHIATAGQSADEYRQQMEQLVQRQRAAAAEESHRLESEVQALSQEQARLLLKLHAVQGDLAKSRALHAELHHHAELGHPDGAR